MATDMWDDGAKERNNEALIIGTEELCRKFLLLMCGIKHWKN